VLPIIDVREAEWSAGDRLRAEVLRFSDLIG
jgi:hypothetical protein